MARSIKKGFFVSEKLLKKLNTAKEKGEKKVIKTWSRASMVIPDMVGYTFAVHNGKKFIPVFITESMIGHRMGEFAPTRYFKSHGGKIQKRSKLKK